MQPKKGGKFHLKLNMGTRPIANKYCEGKMKSTLKRESNSTWNRWKGNDSSQQWTVRNQPGYGWGHALRGAQALFVGVLFVCSWLGALLHGARSPWVSDQFEDVQEGSLAVHCEGTCTFAESVLFECYRLYVVIGWGLRLSTRWKVSPVEHVYWGGMRVVTARSGYCCTPDSLLCWVWK